MAVAAAPQLEPQFDSPPPIATPATAAQAVNMLRMANEVVSSESAYVQSLCVLHDSFIRRLNAACALELAIIEHEEIDVRTFFSVHASIRMHYSHQAH